MIERIIKGGAYSLRKKNAKKKQSIKHLTSFVWSAKCQLRNDTSGEAQHHNIASVDYINSTPQSQWWITTCL
jgi:hypothetical protein